MRASLGCWSVCRSWACALDALFRCRVKAVCNRHDAGITAGM